MLWVNRIPLHCCPSYTIQSRRPYIGNEGRDYSYTRVKDYKESNRAHLEAVSSATHEIWLQSNVFIVVWVHTLHTPGSPYLFTLHLSTPVHHRLSPAPTDRIPTHCCLSNSLLSAWLFIVGKNLNNIGNKWKFCSFFFDNEKDMIGHWSFSRNGSPTTNKSYRDCYRTFVGFFRISQKSGLSSL